MFLFKELLGRPQQLDGQKSSERSLSTSLNFVSFVSSQFGVYSTFPEVVAGDKIMAEHPQKAQLSKSKDGETFTRLWKTDFYNVSSETLLVNMWDWTCWVDLAQRILQLIQFIIDAVHHLRIWNFSPKFHGNKWKTQRRQTDCSEVNLSSCFLSTLFAVIAPSCVWLQMYDEGDMTVWSMLRDYRWPSFWLRRSLDSTDWRMMHFFSMLYIFSDNTLLPLLISGLSVAQWKPVTPFEISSQLCRFMALYSDIISKPAMTRFGCLNA